MLRWRDAYTEYIQEKEGRRYWVGESFPNEASKKPSTSLRGRELNGDAQEPESLRCVAVSVTWSTGRGTELEHIEHGCALVVQSETVCTSTKKHGMLFFFHFLIVFVHGWNVSVAVFFYFSVFFLCFFQSLFPFLSTKMVLWLGLYFCEQVNLRTT